MHEGRNKQYSSDPCPTVHVCWGDWGRMRLLRSGNRASSNDVRLMLKSPPTSSGRANTCRMTATCSRRATLRSDRLSESNRYTATANTTTTPMCTMHAVRRDLVTGSNDSDSHTCGGTGWATTSRLTVIMTPPEMPPASVRASGLLKTDHPLVVIHLRAMRSGAARSLCSVTKATCALTLRRAALAIPFQLDKLRAANT